MPLEELPYILLELRKKLFHIIAIFAVSVILFFSLMGKIITKIQSDMSWRLNVNNTSERLVEISQNLSLISNKLSEENPDVAHNLIEISRELLNISQIYKPNIIYISPMEILLLKLKLSLILGFVITLPFIMYYASKGLKSKVFPMNTCLMVYTIIAAILLFLFGSAYSYYYMLPFFLRFLYQDALSMGITPTFSVYSFIYFVISTTIVIGIAFELPVVLTLLVHLGFTNRQSLASYRRHAYIILLIIAAIITPDPTFFSQIMVTIPFVVLYEISLLIMRFTGK